MNDSEIRNWIDRVFGEQQEPDAPEFFVGQVMSRIRRPAPAPVRLSPRPAWWWVPVLAPALALLLITFAGRGPAVSAEALLETGGGWGAGVSSAQRPAAGDLLDLLGEGS